MAAGEPQPRPFGPTPAVRRPAVPGARVRVGRADHRRARLPAGLRHRRASGRRGPHPARGRAHGRPRRRDRQPAAASRRRDAGRDHRAGLLGVGLRRQRPAAHREPLARGRAARGARARATRVQPALIGSRYIEDFPAASPSSRCRSCATGAIDGAILGRSVRPPDVQAAIDELRRSRLTALGVAVVVAVLVSFLTASAITSRVKRLAESAARISEGELDEPLEGTGGRDEITDLGRALETMRGALRQTFSALREERDRLSAIFEALSDAVMVVSPDGEVRFSNASAQAADRRRRPRDRRAAPVASPGRDPRGGRERRAARRRARLLAQRATAAGGGRGARRRPRPHRGAAPRGCRARLRLQRRPRAAQPDRRDLGRGRGPARRRQGRSRSRAITSSAGSPRTPSGSAA